MKRLLWYITCCWMLSVFSAAAAYAAPESQQNEATGKAASLGRLSKTDKLAPTAKPVAIESNLLAQAPPPPPAPSGTPATTPATPATPDATTPATPTTPATTPAGSTDAETQQIQERLKQIEQNQPGPNDKVSGYQPKTSPAFAIFNPVGFGADKNQVFFSVSYQSRTRFGNKSDGEAGLGIGLGDATNSIGAELSYSLNSFGTSQGFGSGAFNAKLHKRIADDTSVAIGWNQFAKVTFGSGASDYPNNSYYAVGTKIFRTVDEIDRPFSRVAVTAGVGSGVFLPFDPNGSLDRTGLNVFGSLGVRIARPVSAVVEWTGQDLAAGVSIAPFDNFPLVITPAVRDITGAGDGARFVLGAGLAFNF
jgi:hypothetical protein